MLNVLLSASEGVYEGEALSEAENFVIIVKSAVYLVVVGLIFWIICHLSGRS